MITTSLFLTGDTLLPEGSRTQVAAVIIARAASRANKDGKTLELYTGDQPGFEQGVRSFAQALGLDCHIVVAKVDATGEIDYDERHARVVQLVDRVVCMTTNPFESPLVPSLEKIVPAHRLRVYA